MGIKQVKVYTNNLQLGMFISSLDRPWRQTPFPIQGFLIRTEKEIATLRSLCNYVFIDISKGRKATINAPLSLHQLGAYTNNDVKSSGNNKPWIRRVSPIKIKSNIYQEFIPVEQEVEYADKALLNLRGQYTRAKKQIAKGSSFDYDNLKESVADMVSSVVRCPDAFTWLLRLRLKDQHTHDHSMRSALWATQFARHIGMSKEGMSILCMGTLFKDVGKVKLSNSLLRKKDKTEQELEEYQSFVTHGVEMLEAFGGVEPKVISVVKYHCEYFDGTGFPEGIYGAKIPFLARIAGIATRYDIFSNPRESADPIAPSRAVNKLYKMRNHEFPEDLVINFIRSIGLYPTGTLVELTTGDLGVVVEQHADYRLAPKVAVLNQGQFIEGKALAGYVSVDLKDEATARKILVNAGQGKAASVAVLGITRDLEPSSYEVDLFFVATILMKNTRKVLGSVLSQTVNKNLVDPNMNLIGKLKNYLRLRS